MVESAMSPRQRLETVFAGGKPDRTPILGGWIACPDHICTLAGIALEEYWKDPEAASIRAYQELGADGLISLFVPRSAADYRCVDADSYAHAVSGMSLEECIECIDRMPSAEEIEGQFDFDREYETFRKELIEKQHVCDEMMWMPAQWSAGARVTWYGEFGYENFFYIVGAYPDRARKLMEVGGARGHCRGRLVARAVEEGLYPHAVLLGEDICTQRGPMISPDFLEKYYAPELRHGLQPLLEADCKPVWHCDGDVRLLLDMLTDCGIQGFQGFQPECGMGIEQMASRKTRNGERVLIFGPLAVTTELPVMTPEQMKRRVWEVVEICRGQADLVLFTSNTINPDVPLENIRAMYKAVRAL